MTFPTKADIAFFTSEEAKRIQEEWEPRLGDLVCDPKDGNRIAILAHQVEVNKWQAYWPYAKRLLWADVENLIFLPRQGQLQAMLEERGYTVCLTGPYMLPKNYQVILAREDDETEVEYDPTPSIALGRALIEVLNG